jgi:hypothetical protein
MVNNNQKLENSPWDLHKVQSFNILVSLEGSSLSCWGIGGVHAALDGGIVVGRNGSEVLGAPTFDPFRSEAPIRRFVPFRGQRVN